MDRSQFDQLVQHCFEGPLEDLPWRSFMDSLQAALNAAYVTLLVRPPKENDGGALLNALVTSEDAYKEYREHYFALDPLKNLPVGEVLTVEDVVDRETFEKSEFYADYLQKVKIEYILGADLFDDRGYDTQLRVSRRQGSPNFDEADKKLVSDILPYLEQSLRLYTHIVNIETKMKTYQDAFDHMEMGCILLDKSFQIVSKNKTAQLFLKEKLGLMEKDAQVIVGDREENKAFREKIEAMLTIVQNGGMPDVEGFRVNLPHSVTGLGLLIRALPPSTTPDAGPAISVFISDPEKSRLSKVTILEQLFGLTLSEAKLALLLANGASLDEAAEDLGITRNTAKSHLSSTYSKTGVTRQPSLVQLILRSVASIG